MENKFDINEDESFTTSIRNIFTLNNYTEDEVNAIKAWDCVVYLVFGKETGEKCGTPHLQGYVQWKNSRKFSVLKKLNKRISWRVSTAAPVTAAMYCKKGSQSKTEWNVYGYEGPNFGKDADVFEIGEMKKQGARNDLLLIKNKILSGETTVPQILESDPIFFHQYGRTLNALEDLHNKHNFRTEMCTIDWFCGSTGIGKSHALFENYNPNTMYKWNLHEEFQCGYQGEKIVLINEFAGQIPFRLLLEMADKWPMTVKRKGRAPCQFLATKILIAGPKPPWECYTNSLDVNHSDNMNQLKRRCQVWTKKLQSQPWRLLDWPLAGVTANTSCERRGGHEEILAHDPSSSFELKDFK